MTPNEYKALITMVEYTARQVVALRTDITRLRTDAAQNLRRLRESNAQMKAEIVQLKKENRELHTFINP